ncbi:MAG: trypsin-like serine protease [Chloroflexota bacterium]
MLKRTIYLILLCIGITLSSFAVTGYLYADTSVTPEQVAPQEVRIVGGQDVPNPNPYNYQVAINYINASNNFQGQFCGGSVIGDKWILTAAHCLVGEQAADLKVLVHHRQLTGGNEGIEIRVANFIIHEAYNDDTTVNDIAIIQLIDPIPNVEQFAIPLLTQSTEASFGTPGTPAVSTGWGGLRGYSPGSGGPVGGQVYANTLQYVTLPIVSNTDCRNIYGSEILDSMVCAGYLDGQTAQGVQQDTCQADSGGPLVVPDSRNGFIQSGIVSFGFGCAFTYGVYTRVSSFNDWIQEKTGISAGPRPDLVVESINAISTTVEVTIKNQGDGPVAAGNDFWVDVYINPNRAPVQVNETWQFQGTEGLVWGVIVPQAGMQPGESMTLRIGDAFYNAGLSSFSGSIPAGTPIYAQVDSANQNVTSGGVLESNGAAGSRYNNIMGPVMSVTAPTTAPAGGGELLASGSPQQIISTIYLPAIMTQANQNETVQAASTVAVNNLPARGQ